LQIKKVYNSKKTKKLERGIAFPTCVNVNHICLHYSPLKDESSLLKEDDVVKIDLGCHLDGYFAHVGCTIVVSSDPAKKITGQTANLITAGHTALQAALRKVVVGATNDDVTKVIEKVAESYGFSPIEGTYSHKHKKHTLDEKHVIMNKFVPEKKQEKYEF